MGGLGLDFRDQHRTLNGQGTNPFTGFRIARFFMGEAVSLFGQCDQAVDQNLDFVWTQSDRPPFNPIDGMRARRNDEGSR